ncbi:hypothetical protein BDF22DRAFT_272325 [Syncephalis plumigaleata]|nr:hypothetical protein BDF22DRAFT_272325 [Syncephalis plumigaleata]
MAISDRASRVLSTEDVDFNKLEQMYGKQQAQGVTNQQNNRGYQNTPLNNQLTSGPTYAQRQQTQQGTSNVTVETPRSSIYSDGKMSETSIYSTQYTSMTSQQQHRHHHQQQQQHQQHQQQQQQHHRHRSQGATNSAVNATNNNTNVNNNNNTYANKANASRHRPHASAHVSHTIPQISCSNIDDDPDMAMPTHPMLNQSGHSATNTQSHSNGAQQSQQLSLQQRRKIQGGASNATPSQNLQAFDRSRNIARSASAIDLKITDPERITTQGNGLYVQPAHATASVMEFHRNVTDDYPRSAGLLRTDGYNNQNQSAFFLIIDTVFEGFYYYNYDYYLLRL